MIINRKFRKRKVLPIFWERRQVHHNSVFENGELPEQPQRVISLVAAATETLFAMGCGDRVAGGNPIFAERQEGYFVPDLEEVARLRPDLFLLFQELEYPVDAKAIISERGRDRSFTPAIVDSTVTCGRHLIQEGPSILETAAWLQNRFHGKGLYSVR